MKRLVLLGASGSIGLQTIDVVIRHPDEFEIVALSVGRNIDALEEILSKVKVKAVCVQEGNELLRLQSKYTDIEFLSGDEGLKTLALRDDYEMLVNALVGFVGFVPTYEAICSNHDVALANKESLVVGGELIEKALAEHKVNLYPIDSEHSAIFQALQGNRKEEVKNLWITASGGAFRNKKREELVDVTVEDALAHPNWAMGAKITIDSASMMNKGFEVIEAHYLFSMPYDQIKVLMHKESVIHSMVEYVDGSVIAQLGNPDMRLPIQYALTYPERKELDLPRLNLAEIGSLHFEDADVRRFPLLALAYASGKKGGNLPAVINAINDVANQAFRERKISFLDIEDMIIRGVNRVPFKKVNCLEDLLEANAWGVEYAQRYIVEKGGK